MIFIGNQLFWSVIMSGASQLPGHLVKNFWIRIFMQIFIIWQCLYINESGTPQREQIATFSTWVGNQNFGHSHVSGFGPVGWLWGLQTEPSAVFYVVSDSTVFYKTKVYSFSLAGTQILGPDWSRITSLTFAQISSLVSPITTAKTYKIQQIKTIQSCVKF